MGFDYSEIVRTVQSKKNSAKKTPKCNFFLVNPKKAPSRRENWDISQSTKANLSFVRYSHNFYFLTLEFNKVRTIFKTAKFGGYSQ
jgi:hypothetical protein